MISKEDIVKIGRTQKPYGIKGEINILFQKAEYADLDTEFYFLEIDGIPVPFFIEEFTFATDVQARVKFEDISDEKRASLFANLDVFIPREALEDLPATEEKDWDFFIGYSIVDQTGNNLGKIEDVDMQTINTLFIVNNGNDEYLIPATEDFITAIDEKNRIIEMNLPEGLIE